MAQKYCVKVQPSE